MTIRGGYLTGLAILVAVQLLMGFGAIALFQRIGPAVEMILSENVASNEAAEAMAFAAVRFSRDQNPAHRKEFAEALDRARKNVTVEDEFAAIDALEFEGDQFFAGEGAALENILDRANDLIRINRIAMDEADQAAKRLGHSGAWAAVVLSLVGFFISVVVARRMIFEVVEPIEELESVLEASRNGDTFRRCQGRAASPEMRQVLGSINRLLDRAHRIEDELRTQEPL